VKYALERFRVAATGRWAVSIRSFILTIPFVFMINIERENLLNPGNFTRSLAICIAGELASYLYIFIAQATLLKHRSEQLQRLSICVFVWFSAGIVKGVFFCIYAVWAFGYEANYLDRILPSTAFSGISLALLSFYFGTIDRRRIESKALNSLDEFLAVDQGLKIANDAIVRRNVIQVLTQTLIPQLEKLENTLPKISQLNTKTEAHFESLSYQSKELVDTIEFQSKFIDRNRAKAPRERRAFREISLFQGFIPNVISVRLTLIVVVLGMSIGQLTRNGALGVASGLVGTAILGIVVFSLRMFSKTLSSKKLTYLVLASFPIVFLTQMVYVANLSRIGFNLENPYLPAYSAVKTVYGFYLACIVASLVVNTSNEFNDSAGEHEDIRLSIANLDLEQAVLDNHLFATRFGTIQGKITGVTMALHLALNHSNGTLGSEKFDEILTGAMKLLSDARMEIDALSQEFRSA
jgi:hypothetical protein